MTDDAIDDLLRRTLARARELRRLPVSTYRLQFHAGFTFRDATNIIPYLASLGITHVYASPYLAARSGSTHGYDVIDHRRLNPEVGTTADYEAFLAALAANGMTHILDTVPNHVGVATNDNAWWNDVLEHGPASRFADYFDITWRGNARPDMDGRVLVPTLGKPYGEALEAGELKLKFDAGDGAFSVWYFDRRFPISPATYGRILMHRGGGAELRGVIDQIDALPGEAADRFGESQAIKARIAEEVAAHPAVRRQIESAVDDFNGTPGNIASFNALDGLMQNQHFRLADWHVAFDEINYRRFFDVNDLAALRMENPAVFEATHSFIMPLLASGKIAGLRIDHPDGLLDPAEYLLNLQRAYLLEIARTLCDAADWPAAAPQLKEVLTRFAGNGTGPDRWPLFVSVEKILAMDEPLIPDWATHGTSGYDFLAMLNELFVDPAAEPAFDTLWNELAGGTSYDELAYRNKRQMLETTLASELHMLTHRLDRLSQADRRGRDFTFKTLQSALRETIACFEVYRTYVRGRPVTEVDQRHIAVAAEKAKARNPRLPAGVFDFIGNLLTLRASNSEDAIEFAGKFQQLTSPTTAKGIEDTTFYQYNRLLSLNEVGGEPARFGVTAERFHSFCAARQRDWPFAISGSSTHDTKRSEDVRARLNVLSEIPDEWAIAVRQWFKENAILRTTENVPTPAEEYLIYQTLLGAWPIEPPAEPDFGERIQAYVLKAIREAKANTRWGEPDEQYEAGVKAFVDRLVKPEESPAFHRTFQPLLRRITNLGFLNSLSQTLIKIAAPGVPDTYQGTELWDFSLVDPDNRRPVDFAVRQSMLVQVDAMPAIDLPINLEDPHIKLKVTAVALRFRRDHADLFQQGDYAPLAGTGEMAHHIFGFVRTLGERQVAVVTPRWTSKLVGENGLSLGGRWGDTRVTLPAGNWRSVFSPGRSITDAATDIFSDFPVALLVRHV